MTGAPRLSPVAARRVSGSGGLWLVPRLPCSSLHRSAPQARAALAVAIAYQVPLAGSNRSGPPASRGIPRISRAASTIRPDEAHSGSSNYRLFAGRRPGLPHSSELVRSLSPGRLALNAPYSILFRTSRVFVFVVGVSRWLSPHQCLRQLLLSPFGFCSTLIGGCGCMQVDHDRYTLPAVCGAELVRSLSPGRFICSMMRRHPYTTSCIMLMLTIGMVPLLDSSIGK